MKTKTNLQTLLAMAVILFGFGCTIAAGEVIYVDANAPPGGNGQTWSTAYKHLQDALNDPCLSDGDDIWVSRGTYKPDETNTDPNGTGNREATFQLVSGVSIYGGLAGNEDPCTFNLDDRDFAVNETILSGDVNDDDSSYSLMEDFLQCYTGGATSGCEQFDLNEDTYVNCEDLTLFLEAYHYHDNSYHVVTGSGTNSTAVLDGFTITAGNADGIWDDKTSVGGGMYNDNGSPTVANCIFSRNRAHQYGGGMYNNSNPNLINCTFIENSVPGLHCYGGATNGFGGGMCNYQNYLIGPSTLLGCEFIKNWADIGAGMYNYASSPTMSNCIIKENYSISDGAGMYNHFGGPYVSNPVLTNCTFINNTSKGNGGGMYNWNSSSNMKVTNCTFSGNCSWFNGGGMINYCSSPMVTNCTFSGNISWPYVGGQLYMGGGGMYNTGCYCTPNLTNCTFSGNWTRYAGGGIYNNYSNPTITNCILWGNSGEQIHNEASSPIVSYGDIQGGYGGTGNIDEDPCFVNPNGPDGEIGTEDDNLRLSPDSPCIDTGDPNYSDANYPTDLDGRDRFVDGDCNDTVIVDMGAYEYTSAYYGDFDGDCDVDFIDYAIQANYWLTDGFLVDIAPTPAGDGVIDERDLAILCINWLAGTEP